ncbi:pyrimidine reductase family protein [Terrabacter aerolatus]
MQLLVPGRSGLPALAHLDTASLATAYAAPAGSWVRCNMVTSLDGAATGADGRSGSINNDADHVVFEMLRALSHVVVVGAGTIRAEGYPPLSVADSLVETRRGLGLPDALPLVAVSNRGDVPPTLSGCRDGRALLAVPASAPGLAAARRDLGDDNVIVCGDAELDVAALVSALGERGWSHVLTEGGPSLLASFLAADQLDELCFSITPQVVGGEHPRPVGPHGTPVDLDIELLVEQDGTLMGRWLVRRDAS